jgi:hypothetical protein
MKQLHFLAAFIAAASVNANATSYISLGDVANVNPADRGKFIQIEGIAHFDEAFDCFDISLSYSQGIIGVAAGQLEGTYLQYIGEQYIVPMHFNTDVTTIVCESTIAGVSWSAGDYRMFTLIVYVDPDFEAGTITMSSTMSRHDGRQTTYTVESNTQTSLVVSYDMGDVNGDGEVNIADINALIGLILSDATNTRADINADGEVNINDVTALINVMI